MNDRAVRIGDLDALPVRHGDDKRFPLIRRGDQDAPPLRRKRDIVGSLIALLVPREERKPPSFQIHISERLIGLIAVGVTNQPAVHHQAGGIVRCRDMGKYPRFLPSGAISHSGFPPESPLAKRSSRLRWRKRHGVGVSERRVKTTNSGRGRRLKRARCCATIG